MLVGKGAKAAKPKPKKRESGAIAGGVKELLQDLVKRGLLDEVLWGERKDVRSGDFLVAKERKQQRETEYMKMMHEFDYVLDESIYDTTEWTLFLLQHLLNIDYKEPKIQPEKLDYTGAEINNRLSFLSTSFNDMREKVVTDINIPIPLAEDVNVNTFFITDENEQCNLVEDEPSVVSQRQLYRQYIPEYNLLTLDVVFTVFWGEMVVLNNTVLKLLQDFNGYGNTISNNKTGQNEGVNRASSNKNFRRSAEDILNRLKYKQENNQWTTGDVTGAPGTLTDHTNGKDAIGNDSVLIDDPCSIFDDSIDGGMNEERSSEHVVDNHTTDGVNVMKFFDADDIVMEEELTRAMGRSRWRELTKWIREEAVVHKATNSNTNRTVRAPTKHLKDLIDHVQKHRISMTHIWSESLSSQAPEPAVDTECGDNNTSSINVLVPSAEPVSVADNNSDFLGSIDRNIRRKTLKTGRIPVRHVLTMNTLKLEYTHYFPETLFNEMVTYDEIVSSICILQSSEILTAGIDCNVIGSTEKDKSYRLVDSYGRVDTIARGGTIDDRIEKSRSFHIHIQQSFASQDTDYDSDNNNDDDMKVADDPIKLYDTDLTVEAQKIDSINQEYSHVASTASSCPQTSDQDIDENDGDFKQCNVDNKEVCSLDQRHVVTNRIVDLELESHVATIPQIRWNESSKRIICERNKTGRKPKMQRMLTRYPIRNFGQEFEEVIYDPETYLLHIFSTRNGLVVSHNIVHVSSIYVTRSLFHDMVTIRSKSQLITNGVDCNGYLGTIRATYWNLLINEIHYSVHGAANQFTDTIKGVKEKWKAMPQKDTLYRDSQSLMQSRLVDAEHSSTNVIEKSKCGVVSDFGDDFNGSKKLLDHSQLVPSDKTIVALKVEKNAGMNTGVSQLSFVDSTSECTNDDDSKSVSIILNNVMNGLLAEDKGTLAKKITTLTIPLATSDYSRAGEVNKSPRKKFIPQLPTSHNNSSKTKSPISNRSKYINKPFLDAGNIFVLRGTAPVYHDYPRSSPVDVRTPKKHYVVANAMDSKVTSVITTENSNSVSVGIEPVNSTFSPVHPQLQSLDSLSHYSLQNCIKVSPPTLPVSNVADDHLLLLIESRTVYQHYFCEKFQIIDVVCDPCINFHDACDLLVDSPLSYDVIFISLSDLITCKDMKNTLEILNPRRIYSIVVYGAFGATSNMDVLGQLQDSGVTNILEEPYSLLDMKKLMQTLRKDRYRY